MPRARRTIIKLLILQLGDIHIRSGRANPVCDRALAISQAAHNACPDASHILLLLSGDIAFAGLSDEYAQALEFVESVVQFVQKRRAEETEVCCAVIPGNHDCDFSGDQSARDKLLQSLSPEELDKPSIFSIAAEPQANFRDFVERIASMPVYSPLSKSVMATDLEIGDQMVRLVLLNSAACSRRHEVAGQLSVAHSSLNDISGTNPGPHLSLVLSHHPLHWFDPESVHAIRNHIIENGSVLITGHEHSPSQLQLQKDTQLSHLIEGGALQVGSGGEQSEFNVLVADFESGQLAHTGFRWKQTLYLGSSPYLLSWKADPAFDAKPLRLNLTKERMGALNDIGSPLVHPRKAGLNLSDVFVMPELRELPGLLSADTDRKIVESERVLARLLDLKIAHISGAARTGKTALANRLFYDMWRRKGMLPLYASGRELRSRNDSELSGCIGKIVSKNYNTNHVDEYLNSSYSKCLIIDGLGETNLNQGRREEILKYLSGRFDNIWVFDRRSLELSDLMFREASLPTFSQMVCFDILPLSRSARSDVVERWVRLGRTGFDSEEDVDAEVVDKDKLIDLLIGRDLVMPTPFYILSLLGAVEQGVSTDENLGSIGYLYETIIRGALLQHVKDRSALQTYDRFLSSLAYGMRSQGRLVLSSEEFQDVCDEFAERHLIELSATQLLQECVDAQILAYESGSVAFRYPYVLYFFIARYLSQRLSREEGRQAVVDLVADVNDSEASKILLFLCYCTSDPFVIETILQSAAGILEGVAEADLEADSAFLINSAYKPRKLRLGGRSPSKNRQLLRRESDAEDQERRLSKVDRPVGMGDEEPDEDARMAELHAGQIVSAFRILEVMGQILRNHITIEGEVKGQLIREGMKLTRRVLSVMLVDMRESSSATIERVESYILAQQASVSADKATLLARRIFAMNVQQITVGIVSIYASELGTTALQPAFKRVLLDQADDTVKVLDLAVKLENPRAFPEKEALELEKRFRSHTFLRECLSGMVFMYMYLYGVSDYKKRQRVCAKFDIEVQQPAILRQELKRLGKQ